MDPYDEAKLKRWFVLTFIHSAPGRRFALENLGLEEGAPHQARVIQRNARYYFTIVKSDEVGKIGELIYLVHPLHPEADWTRGKIWYWPVNRAVWFKSAVGQIR